MCFHNRCHVVTKNLCRGPLPVWVAMFPSNAVPALPPRTDLVYGIRPGRRVEVGTKPKASTTSRKSIDIARCFFPVGCAISVVLWLSFTCKEVPTDWCFRLRTVSEASIGFDCRNMRIVVACYHSYALFLSLSWPLVHAFK